MNIIKAESKHAEVLATLLQPIQKLHADRYPDLFKYPLNHGAITTFFSKQLSKPNAAFFIAQAEDRPVGYLWCTLEKHGGGLFKHPHSKVYIHHISVNPESQGKGAGRHLLAAAERFAESNGITKIELDSWGFNSQAHNFFEGMGYSKFNVGFWKVLEL